MHEDYHWRWCNAQAKGKCITQQLHVSVYDVTKLQYMECVYGCFHFPGPKSTMSLNIMVYIFIHYMYKCIPYSQKYWRELNLAVEPKIAIAGILVDLNLAVWYGIAIRIYASRKFRRIIIWQL